MRWRLGRSNAMAFCARKPAAPAEVFAALTEPRDTTATNAAADAVSHRMEGSSESVALGAIETRGDNGDEFHNATANSCLRSSARSGNDETAGRVGRSHARDGLSLSFLSFVENLESRRRPRTFLPEDTEPMSRSTGTTHASGDRDDWKNCATGAASVVVSTISPSVERNKNVNEEATSAVTPSTSSPRPGNRKAREEDPLLPELHDHILRRGILVDSCAALGSARVCLDLMLSREMTMEAMQKTGPTELISFATANLGLGASEVAFLLGQLVDSESTAFRLAGPHLLRPLNAAARIIQQVGGQGDDGNASPACVRHYYAREKRVDGAEQRLKAAKAAMALSEACRTWRDTIEAARSMTKRVSCCDSNGSKIAGATARVVLGGTSEEEAEHPSSSMPLRQPSESPRTQHHSLTRRNNVASAPITGTVGIPQLWDEDHRHKCHDNLRLAIRMVTSGANNCYGQLVVLGHKEFTVRDSTWHRVGSKNEIFVLGRRQAANGVRIGRSSVNVIRRVGGGDGDSRSRRALTVPINDNACQPPCQTPTGDNSMPHDENDCAGSGNGINAAVGSGEGRGDQAASEAPDTRPNELRNSRGERDPPHRASGVGRAGGVNTVMAKNDGGVCGDGNGDDGGRHRGRRVCFSSGRWEGKPVAAAERLGAFHVVQLSLSSQQREAARDVENEKCASNTQAAGERRQHVVEIPCVADDGFDMFQLGRMQGVENDFVVKGPLHKSQPGGKVCGPVSRYAVRLLVDRSPPHRCTIFAGGFNSRRCLALPKASPKWLKENGDWDAVTPFGVRILKPEVGEWREVTVTGAVRRTRVGCLDTVGDLVPGETNELTSGTVIDVGGVQMLFESAESMATLGGVQPSRVIELLNDRKPQCPVQLRTLRFKPLKQVRRRTMLWSSGAAGDVTGEGTTTLRGSAGSDAARAACGGGSRVLDGVVVAGTSEDTATTSVVAAAAENPDEAVNVRDEDGGENTDSEGDGEDDVEEKAHVPHIFPACGHVHGYAKQLALGPCPMCRAPGALVEIQFGWCQAIDREIPTVVFNPCGHAASLDVAERWSRSAMPNNAPPDAVYRPICPYCAKPLQCKAGERYSKMIFAE